MGDPETPEPVSDDDYVAPARGPAGPPVADEDADQTGRDRTRRRRLQEDFNNQEQDDANRRRAGYTRRGGPAAQGFHAAAAGAGTAGFAAQGAGGGNAGFAAAGGGGDSGSSMNMKRRNIMTYALGQMPQYRGLIGCSYLARSKIERHLDGFLADAIEGDWSTISLTAGKFRPRKDDVMLALLENRRQFLMSRTEASDKAIKRMGFDNPDDIRARLHRLTVDQPDPEVYSRALRNALHGKYNEPPFRR